ncbi:MAG TPA: serine/threonine-protein phosphatase, partial [Pseudogulbenkiania sp.]|nr:serine/threonine-protein phosphatase [Pseudogulbenkiania sp.]
ERRGGRHGDNLSAVAVTLLDEALDVSQRSDVLDTHMTLSRRPSSPRARALEEEMHREILASRPDKSA